MEEQCGLKGFTGDMCRTQQYCFLEQYFFQHELATEEPNKEKALSQTRNQLHIVNESIGCLKRPQIAQRLLKQLTQIQNRPD